MMQFIVKKFLISIASSSLLIGIVLITPPAALAQSPGFLQNFVNQFQQRWDRFFLRLPGNKSGIKVLQQSLLAMGSAQSFKLSGHVQIDTTTPEMGNSRLELTVTGPVMVKDIYDPSSAQQDLKITGKISAEGTSLEGDIDLKIDGRRMFVKLNQLPALPFLPIPTTELKDQWILFEKTETADDQSAIDSPISPEDRAQLQAIYQQLLKASRISTARKETVDGQRVFIIEVVIPDEALVQYFKSLADLGSVNQKMTEVEKTAAAENINRALATLDELKIIFQVRRDDFYLTAIDLSLVMNASQLQDLLKSEAGAISPLTAGQVGNLSIQLGLKLTDYNQPVEFNLPSDYRRAEEVMAQIMGGLGGNSNFLFPTGDSEKNIDQDQLQKILKPGNPVELPELTPAEQELLKKYGVGVEGP